MTTPATTAQTTTTNRAASVGWAAVRTVAGLIAAIYIGLQWGPFISWGGPVMAFFAVFATPVIVCLITARLVFLVGPLASIIGTVSLALHMFHEYRRVTVNPITDPWRWVNSAGLFPLYHFALVFSTVVALVVAYGFYRMRRADEHPKECR